MTVTSPRSTRTWPDTVGYGRLMALFCLVCLTAGSPVQKEAKMSSQQRSANPVLGPPEKPAAHFQANPYILGSLNWTTNVEYAFSQGSLVLENNKLHVKHKGLYFIYSQAMFGGRMCPQPNKNLVSLSVMLESFEGNDNVQLLRADKTPCEQLSSKDKKSEANWNKSIFLGAVFKLDEHDILYVTTSGTEFLTRDRGTTYFGAYAL